MPRETYVLKKKPDGSFDLVPREQVPAWTEKYWPKRGKHKAFMPKKVQRGAWVWRDGKLVERHLAPSRQGSGHGLQVIKDIEPFQNIAIDNGYIGGRKQRRDMMKAHGLIEIGNEKPRPSPREIANERRHRPDPQIVAELKRASQGKWL